MSERDRGGTDPLANPLWSDRPPRTSREYLETLARHECPAFAHRQATRPGGAVGPKPLVLARGEGSTLYDVDGNAYVDLVAGFGAALLGHAHPAIVGAIAAQSERLVQGLGDVFASDAKADLLEVLSALHPRDHVQVMLGQSGSDAVTAAVKTATLATERHAIVAFDGSYHGLGYAPLAACGFRSSFRLPFTPQLSRHVRFAPYPGLRGASEDAALSMLREYLQLGDVAAVLVEPILGRGGMVVPPATFLAEVCRLAHAAGALVIADEVWTGIGRTGTMLRSEHDGADVDILCLGKGLGGGLPISACLAPAEIMAAWTQYGEVVHTSTHVGAPLGCRAAQATLKAMRELNLIDRAARVGRIFMTRLEERLGERALVRGAGLMIGIELANGPAAQSCAAELQRRGFVVLTGGPDGEVLTLTPALTIAQTKLDELVDALDDVLA